MEAVAWDRTIMETTRIESARTELFHFVLWLLLVLLGVTTYFALRYHGDSILPWLSIVGLLACLYAVGRERQLTRYRRRLQDNLTEEQDKSKSLEDRLMELSGLYRAISAVNAATSAEGTFDAVLRSALALVRGTRGSLMLLGEDDDHLIIAAAEGLSEDIIRKTSQRVGEGVAGWVAENREPLLLIGRATDDARFRKLIEHRQPVNYSMSIPLVLRETVLGVLNIGVITDDPVQGFSDTDFRIATIFAQHASVAIENARLRLMHNVVLTVED